MAPISAQMPFGRSFSATIGNSAPGMRLRQRCRSPAAARSTGSASSGSTIAVIGRPSSISISPEHTPGHPSAASTSTVRSIAGSPEAGCLCLLLCPVPSAYGPLSSSRPRRRWLLHPPPPAVHSPGRGPRKPHVNDTMIEPQGRVNARRNPDSRQSLPLWQSTAASCTTPSHKGRGRPPRGGEPDGVPGAGCGGPGGPSQRGSMPTEDERGRNTGHSRSQSSEVLCRI